MYKGFKSKRNLIWAKTCVSFMLGGTDKWKSKPIMNILIKCPSTPQTRGHATDD